MQPNSQMKQVGKSLSLQSLIYFIRLGRPLFLVGGFVFHSLGIGIALYQGIHLNWAAVTMGQAAISSIQLMTHYSNDYFDLEADRANTANTRWSGGSRVLPQGLLPARAALTGAVGFAIAAVMAILALGIWIQPSIWTFILPLLALALAWEYSSPPLKLHSRGVGELTVAAIVPILTPLVGYTFQTGSPGWLPLLAAFPLACLQVCMIISVNLPDAAGDRLVEKHTLVVRLGAEGAARWYVFSLAVAYLSLPLLVGIGLPWFAALAGAFPLPLAAWLAIRMNRGDWENPSAWNSLAFWSIGLLIASGALMAAAFYGLAFF